MSARHCRASCVALVFLASVLGSRRTPAQTVVVPDNYPTIQAAINSHPARILVRDGNYAEDLSTTALSSAISIEPYPHWVDGEYIPSRDSHPTIAGSVDLGLLSGVGLPVVLLGFHITGHVAIGARADLMLAECQVDGGISGGEPAELRIRGCIVRGGINASGWYGEITGNTVLGDGIVTYSSATGCCMAVRDNYVTGPAPIGITYHDGGTNGFITGNTVVGCVEGIVFTSPDHATVTDNVVMDCAGNAYRVQGDCEYTSLSFRSNTALRCGGDGFKLSIVRTLEAIGNKADSCAGYGLNVSACDIFGDPPPATLTDNVILHSGLDGIHVEGRAVLSRNIVGRSHDRGVAVTSDPTKPVSLDHNTSYWNGGAGFDLGASVGGTIANNIAYANQHQGLVWSVGATPSLACNDWFANVGGATSGVAPGATDLAVDPLFCNVPADDVHLATFSPLHNAPGCGLIGALDVGCSEPTGLSLPIGRTSFLARPQPTMGAVRFEWGPQATPGEVEVYDAMGARRWHAKALAGSTGLDWRCVDASGNSLPSGVYFARLTRGGVVEKTRVVIAR